MPGRLDKDHELIRQAQQGDPHAFGDLYEKHAPAIFRYLCAHLGNAMDAEDLTGEVFLKAWQSLPNYVERGVPFLAFLFKIARNTLVDHYRQNHHDEPKAPEELDGIKADGSTELSETIGKQIEQQRILRLLRQLKRDYQEVLTLRFISELSPDETASAMNRSAGAVRVLQHRALAALREKMNEIDGHEK